MCIRAAGTLLEDDAGERAVELGSLYKDADAEMMGANHPLVWEHQRRFGRRALMISPMWVSSLQYANGTRLDYSAGQVRPMSVAVRNGTWR